jgi:methylmalonyl-CoA mutase
VVGVNAHKPETDIEVDVLKVDNRGPARQLSGKAATLKGTRDPAATEAHSMALTRARKGTATCWPFAIDAARAKATVGEISLCDGEGLRPPPSPRSRPSGVYRKALGDPIPCRPGLQAKLDAFEKKTGGKPRILVAKMGQDGHDRGQKVIARPSPISASTSTVGALFQTPGRDRQAGRRAGRPHRRRLVAGGRTSDADPRTEAPRWPSSAAATS